MDEKDYLPVLEGILFTMGKSVEISRLAQALELSEGVTADLLKELGTMYRKQNRGLQLLFLEDRVQLCTKPEYYEYLIRIAAQPRKHVLTESVLETLSIVAYKQPVTRSEIERIRGVKSDHAINRLLEYDLIEEAGRLDAPGRPILFATTEEFLRCFGVSSLGDLPVAEPGRLEAFKEEAEGEIPVTV
ncbi:MAG: SMC-Scp complex subunit ScpB [Lachnospiraceae bacterium]|nr:SMC-Scp complex subunit ScpB [Lachnospiraceae bacterium]